jgi:hypothetical protein
VSVAVASASLGILVAAAGVQCSGAGGSAEGGGLLPLVVHHIATGGDGSIECLPVGCRKTATASEHACHAVPSWRGTAGGCGGWGHR